MHVSAVVSSAVVSVVSSTISLSASFSSASVTTVVVAENRNLHDLIQEVSVPTETVVEIKEDGSKKEVERKIFPSYVLVKMVMNDDTWYVVRNIRGCTEDLRHSLFFH